MPNQDSYFDRPEVSNSTLSWLDDYWTPEYIKSDKQAAYRFGTLVDAMITEQHKINYYRFTCEGTQYLEQEFFIAEEMKKSFYRDPMCKMLAENSDFQKITIREDFPIEYDGFKFTLNMRCKWDLAAHRKLNMGGDIKSTTATTQKQFLAACHQFNYFRQRALYMDLEGADKDLLIGISKIYPHSVFKIPITRGHDLYNLGKSQYQELAFKYYYLFENLSKMVA
jgi:hypothetical protein